MSFALREARARQTMLIRVSRSGCDCRGLKSTEVLYPLLITFLHLTRTFPLVRHLC
jgi:hypothetical protein